MGEWIRVEERLPDKNGKYIVCNKSGAVYQTKFYTYPEKTGGHWGQKDNGRNIIAWMPMPEVCLPFSMPKSVEKARYIDANNLLEKLSSLRVTSMGLRCGKTYFEILLREYRKRVIQIVEEQPTADVAEVKHGKFIKRTPCSEAECDQCGKCPKLIFGILPSYCPHCGAKMDGERKENERTIDKVCR